MPKKKTNKGGYVTRTQAVRYLQVSLADFRRLCILKGIYPRDLSGKAKRRIQKGSTKPLTAYNRKDIQYLAHEPVLDKFRAHKIFARKLSRAIGRGDYTDAQRIDANRPRYTLDHIIKERYPTFIDAIGDLDDALSMLFLFAQLPATDKVSHRITEDAARLTTEWTAFIARENLLKKVFVSIKGIYYQAIVRGQEVTWVVPHKFPQNLPSDVDFRIMLTFLEFYTTLVHFVLYKLYTDASLIYPPPINAKKEKGVGGLGTYILESRTPSSLNIASTEPAKNSKPRKNGSKVQLSLEKAQLADEQAMSDEAGESSEDEAGNSNLDEFKVEAEGGDSLSQPNNSGTDLLFSNFTFFIGREVPLDLMEFVALAHGGKVISEAAIDELIDNEDEKASNDYSRIQLNLDAVTHHICDRPAISNKVPGRIYIQPQWLLDSVNQSKLAAVGPYGPGETLPPHLSPWGDRGTYDPASALADEEGDDEDDEDEEVTNEDNKLAKPADVAEEHGDEDEEADEAEDEEEKQLQRELQLEAQGVKYSEVPSTKAKKRKTKKSDTDEDKELRKTMMTKKQKVLYDKVQGGIDKQKQRQVELSRKRKQLKK